MSRVVVLSGISGCGKTTACRRAAELAIARGLRVGGVLTLPRAGGLDVLDVRTGERRLLADDKLSTSGKPVLESQCVAPLETGQYRFQPEGLAWGAAALAGGASCDLFLVDELGPLELLRGGGWSAAAWTALRTGTFRLACVVVRPALLNRFEALLGVPSEAWPVTVENRDALPARLVARLVVARLERTT